MMYLDPAIQADIVQMGDPDDIADVFEAKHGKSVFPPLEQLQCYLVEQAVRWNHVELVRELCRRRYPLQYKITVPRPPPLHLACSQPDINVELVKLLLSNGADVYSEVMVSWTAKRPQSALELCMKQDNLMSVNLLLSYYDSKESSEGQTALLIACRAGAWNIMKYLLKEGKYGGVNEADLNGWTPLLACIEHGESKYVKMLLEAGANVKVRTNVCKSSCLHVAVEKLHPQLPEILQELCEAGASPDNCDVYGVTPLEKLLYSLSKRYGGSQLTNSSGRHLQPDIPGYKCIFLESVNVLLKYMVFESAVTIPKPSLSGVSFKWVTFPEIPGDHSEERDHSEEEQLNEIVIADPILVNLRHHFQELKDHLLNHSQHANLDQKSMALFLECMYIVVVVLSVLLEKLRINDSFENETGPSISSVRFLVDTFLGEFQVLYSELVQLIEFDDNENSDSIGKFYSSVLEQPILSNIGAELSRIQLICSQASQSERLLYFKYLEIQGICLSQISVHLSTLDHHNYIQLVSSLINSLERFRTVSCENNSRLQEIQDFVKDVSQPQRLKSLCRAVIFNSCHPLVIRSVGQIGLPSSLQSYILSLDE